jgi:hypothetical protein
MATSHMRLNARDHCNLIRFILLKKAETLQVHLTLEGEGFRPKETIIVAKSTWDSYMVDYKQCLMVCRNLPHALLQ